MAAPKLSVESRRLIICLCLLGAKHQNVARMFDVSRRSVYDIANRITGKELYRELGIAGKVLFLEQTPNLGEVIARYNASGKHQLSLVWDTSIRNAVVPHGVDRRLAHIQVQLRWLPHPGWYFRENDRADWRTGSPPCPTREAAIELAERVL